MSLRFLSAKTVLLSLVLFVLYLASTIPVGLFLYSIKSEAGINLFSRTGFHSYLHCLKTQALAIAPETEKPAPKAPPQQNKTKENNVKEGDMREKTSNIPTDGVKQKP